MLQKKEIVQLNLLGYGKHSQSVVSQHAANLSLMPNNVHNLSFHPHISPLSSLFFIISSEMYFTLSLTVSFLQHQTKKT